MRNLNLQFKETNISVQTANVAEIAQRSVLKIIPIIIITPPIVGVPDFNNMIN